MVAFAFLGDFPGRAVDRGPYRQTTPILAHLSMEVNTQGIGVFQVVHELSEALRGLCTTRQKSPRQRDAKASPFLVELLEHLLCSNSTTEVEQSGTRLQREEWTPTKRSSSQQKEGDTGSVCTESRWRAFPARTRSWARMSMQPTQSGCRLSSCASTV